MQPDPLAGMERRYVDWEEVFVSNDKGRREVHYLLKDATGGAEVAVIGKERSVRHMYYAPTGPFAGAAYASVEPSPSRSPARLPAEGATYRWRSRREVIDWLSSLISDSTSKSSPMAERYDYMDDDDADFADVPSSKPSSSEKVGHNLKDFLWIGPSSDCRKKRKHYQSFCRKGIKISVHEFVYVMSEDMRRLVAYVEDLYEDLRANKMVVVRWFHRADEVGIALPLDVSEKEVFFSHCLQDFSVECIDGLATVLSAQHFEMFQRKKHSDLQPFMCRSMIDNDDMKPFDVTHIKGYWSQEVVRSISAPSLKLRLKIGSRQADSDVFKRQKNVINDVVAKCSENSEKRLKVGNATHGLPPKANNSTFQSLIHPGCFAEILSQDSGIRGCWFRCMVLKVCHDKVKVQYIDLRNSDETGFLEEWVLLSRIAAPDVLGIRMCGRPVVRPQLVQRVRIPSSFEVGTIVDAWWLNGWWEGIVISRESDEKIHVYFPGEKRTSVFGHGQLRHSLDWMSSSWKPLKDRNDIVCSLLSNKEHETYLSAVPKLEVSNAGNGDLPVVTHAEELRKSMGNEVPRIGCPEDAQDLSKELLLSELKWPSRKRKRHFSGSKRNSDTSSASSQEDLEKFSPRGGLDRLSLAALEHEVSKVGGDPLFVTQISVSNLLLT